MAADRWKPWVVMVFSMNVDGIPVLPRENNMVSEIPLRKRGTSAAMFVYHRVPTKNQQISNLDTNSLFVCKHM